MMVEQVEAQLEQPIADLASGDEQSITEQNRRAARIVGLGAPARKPRRPGGANGKRRIVENDGERLKDLGDAMR